MIVSVHIEVDKCVMSIGSPAAPLHHKKVDVAVDDQDDHQDPEFDDSMRWSKTMTIRHEEEEEGLTH